MDIKFVDQDSVSTGALVVFSNADKNLLKSAKAIDKKTNGALSKAMESNNFKGKNGQMVELLAPSGVNHSRVLLVGLGKTNDLTNHKQESLGGSITAKMLLAGDEELFIAADDDARASLLAVGVVLRSYRFDKYRTKEPKSKKPTLKSVVFGVDDVAAANSVWANTSAVLEGVYFTRDLVNEPGNILYPTTFAERIETLTDLGVEVEVIGEADLERMGMGALVAVGQGSSKESKVAIMRWNGSTKGKDDAPVALIGKGVTFDSGGISLKPGAGMDEMKWDMGGAGIVVGAMKAIAGRKAKVNVVAIVGLVENMPGSNATRPGDVVTSLSGQTIEVLNTDAEGRLVLADILWYAQDKYKPKVMIDFATLTGAIITALGKNQYAGMFTDNDEVAKQLSAAGEASADKVWRMPLSDAYDKLINSPIADMKNLGGPAGGSITAAQFLKRYTNKVPWAHIDVAGMVWAAADNNLWAKGATGYGVRLVNQYIADNFEA
jgi:leucyl aminopeptidase